MITMWPGRDMTTLGDDGWNASCHRRRSRGSVTVACKELAEDVPWAEGAALTGCLLLSGSSSVPYLWQAHSNVACFLLAGWFCVHLVSSKELA